MRRLLSRALVVLATLLALCFLGVEAPQLLGQEGDLVEWDYVSDDAKPWKRSYELRLGAYYADSDTGPGFSGGQLGFVYHRRSRLVRDAGWRIAAAVSQADTSSDDRGDGLTVTHERDRWHAGIEARRAESAPDKHTTVAGLIAGMHERFQWRNGDAGQWRVSLRASDTVSVRASEGQDVGLGAALVTEVVWPYGIVQTVSWSWREITQRFEERDVWSQVVMIGKRWRR